MRADMSGVDPTMARPGVVIGGGAGLPQRPARGNAGHTMGMRHSRSEATLAVSSWGGVMCAWPASGVSICCC